MSDLIQGPFHDMELISDAACATVSLELDAPKTLDNTTYYWSKNLDI